MSKQIIQEYQDKLANLKVLPELNSLLNELDSYNLKDSDLIHVYDKMLKDNRLCRAFVDFCNKNNKQKYSDLLFMALYKLISEGEPVNRYYLNFTVSLFLKDKNKLEKILKYYKYVKFINNNESHKNILGILDLNLQDLLPTEYIEQVLTFFAADHVTNANVKKLYRPDLKLNLNIVIYVLKNDISEFYFHKDFMKIFDKNKINIKRNLHNIEKAEEILNTIKQIENF